MKTFIKVASVVAVAVAMNVAVAVQPTGNANNNYQACLNGNNPSPLQCEEVYINECEASHANDQFSGWSCEVPEVEEYDEPSVNQECLDYYADYQFSGWSCDDWVQEDEMEVEQHCGYYSVATGYLVIDDVAIVELDQDVNSEGLAVVERILMRHNYDLNFDITEFIVDGEKTVVE